MLDSLTLEELEAEVMRRKNRGKGAEYKGFYLQESTYQDGHHVPGPRSPGEGYDYYTTEYKVDVYDAEGVHLKTVYGRLDSAQKYVDAHLTPEGRDAKAKSLEEFKVLSEELTQAKKHFEELKHRIWNLETKYYDLKSYVEG